MKKIKVLFIGMSDNIGGIEKYLINFYRNYDKKKFDIKFLIFGNITPCFYDEIKNDIIRISNRNNMLQFRKELKDVYKNNDFDYIHINLMSFSFFEPITFAKKYSNAKIILHSHIANRTRTKLITKVISKIGEFQLKNKKYFLKTACSTDAGEYMFRNFKNKEFTVLNNGINLDEFKFNKKVRDKIRKQLKLSDKDILIGHVGRFVEQKNHRFLIDIFNDITKKNNNARLCLIGNGGLKEEIIEKSKNLNIYDKIFFLENINNVNEYMSAFDVLLFPSLFEGLSIVLVEAQTAGLKCFITDTLALEGDFSDKIVRLSLSDSSSCWADKILSSLDDIDRKIPDKIKDYDIVKTTKQLEEFYKKNMK